MRCQSCGKEIADKAIICYRCGAPTAVPERPSPSASSTAQAAGTGLLIALLVALAGGAGLLYWQQTEPWTYAALVGAVVAAGVGLRLGRSRRPPA